VFRQCQSSHLVYSYNFVCDDLCYVIMCTYYMIIVRQNRMYTVQRCGLLIHRCGVVCVSVCLLVTTVIPTKTVNLLFWVYRLRTWVGPRNHVQGGPKTGATMLDCPCLQNVCTDLCNFWHTLMLFCSGHMWNLLTHYKLNLYQIGATWRQSETPILLLTTVMLRLRAVPNST